MPADEAANRLFKRLLSRPQRTTSEPYTLEMKIAECREVIGDIELALADCRRAGVATARLEDEVELMNLRIAELSRQILAEAPCGYFRN